MTPEARPAIDGAQAWAVKLQDLGALGPSANAVQDDSAMGDLPTVPNIAFISAAALGSRGIAKIKQRGGGRRVDMAGCWNHGCRRDPAATPPTGMGEIPPDPDNDPGDELPPGGDPDIAVGATGSGFAPSGNTPAMQAAVNSQMPPPPFGPGRAPGSLLSERESIESSFESSFDIPRQGKKPSTDR